MLHGSSTNPSAALFNRATPYQRSLSYSYTPDDDVPPVNLGRAGATLGAATNTDEGLVPGPSGSYAGDSDVRRAKSLRTAGVFGGLPGSRILEARRDISGLPSFAAAGSSLTSPALSASDHYTYTPPAASRHPLFSHHASPNASGLPLSQSPTIFSDPGEAPPSPTLSNPSSLGGGGFSPASAFLSHFSSQSSLRPPPQLPLDAQGAKVLKYTLGKVVGRGGFSTVRKTVDEATGEVFACKIVKRDDLSDRSGSLEKFEEEIRIWQGLPRHPSFLPLLEMHRTDKMTFLFIPYLPGGSLLDVLRRDHGSEATARRFFPGVVAAVAALHLGFDDWEGGVLHGDLKLDNFLVDHAGNVVVCDFYMSQKLSEGSHPALYIPPPLGGRGRDMYSLNAHHNHHRQSRKSSPLPKAQSQHAPAHRRIDADTLPAQPFPSASLPYAPPELLRAPPPFPALSQDIWALGVILYALLTDKLPFVDAFDPRLQLKILRGTWEQPAGLGREWLECLRGCLDTEASTRWDIATVQQCDAVVGWREVKGRSKSRSRSRMRTSPTSEFRQRRRNDSNAGSGSTSQTRVNSQHQSRNVTPGSDPFERKDTHRPLPQPVPIRQVQGKDRTSYPPHSHHLDPGADVFGSSFPESQRIQSIGSGSGSGSGGDSRSRSRGRRMFDFPAGSMDVQEEEVERELSSMSITRGRTMATKAAGASSPGPLAFRRQQHPAAAGQGEEGGLMSYSKSVSRSRNRDSTSASRSRSSHRPLINTSNPHQHHSGFPSGLSPNTPLHPLHIHSDHDQHQTQQHMYSSERRDGSTSRSRGREGQSSSPAEAWGLGVVDEEMGARHHRG